MIEKLIESFAAIFRIHGGVDQFANVFNSRVSFRRVLGFQDFYISGAVDQKFKEFGNVGRLSGSAKTFDRGGIVTVLRRIGFCLQFVCIRSSGVNKFSTAEIEGRGVELGLFSSINLRRLVLPREDTW